jgi:hypothetical protein
MQVAKHRVLILRDAREHGIQVRTQRHNLILEVFRTALTFG